MTDPIDGVIERFKAFAETLVISFSHELRTGKEIEPTKYLNDIWATSYYEIIKHFRKELLAYGELKREEGFEAGKDTYYTQGHKDGLRLGCRVGTREAIEAVERFIDSNDDGMWSGRETADTILRTLKSKDVWCDHGFRPERCKVCSKDAASTEMV